MKELLDSDAKCLVYVSWSLRVGTGRNQERGQPSTARRRAVQPEIHALPPNKVGSSSEEGKNKGIFVWVKKTHPRQLVLSQSEKDLRSNGVVSLKAKLMDDLARQQNKGLVHQETFKRRFLKNPENFSLNEIVNTRVSSTPRKHLLQFALASSNITSVASYHTPREVYNSKTEE